MSKTKFFKRYPLAVFFAYFALSHIILLPSFRENFLKPSEDEKILKRKMQSITLNFFFLDVLSNFIVFLD